MAERDDLNDGQGVAFAEYRLRLPERAADFPPAKIVRCQRTVESYRYIWLVCQVCRLPLTTRQGDVHHVIGGAGRSDEECNLLRVCNSFAGCHDESWSVMLPVSLWAKQRTDRENTDWVRLAVLLGHHLPEPLPPPWYNEGNERRDG